MGNSKEIKPKYAFLERVGGSPVGGRTAHCGGSQQGRAIELSLNSAAALRGKIASTVPRMRAIVRFGSLADIEAINRDVRFTPKSGH
jgi:hypothetical protein